MNLFYSQSVVILDDYILKKWLSPPEEPIFEFNSRYQYQGVAMVDTPLSDREFAQVNIRADNSMKYHRRQTYRLIEYLGDIGGLIQIIWLCGSLVVGFLIER